jgi:hypothetical protein
MAAERRKHYNGDYDLNSQEERSNGRDRMRRITANVKSWNR